MTSHELARQLLALPDLKVVEDSHYPEISGVDIRSQVDSDAFHEWWDRKGRFIKDHEEYEKAKNVLPKEEQVIVLY